MQFGRYYEEFEVGETYKHWPGKTVTEYDVHCTWAEADKAREVLARMNPAV